MALPRPTGSFHWTQTAWGPALVCGALEPFARHFFTTRHWTLGTSIGPDHTAGWQEVAAEAGVDVVHLVRIHQVHGAAVIVRGRGEPLDSRGRPDADISMTDDPSIALAIQTADCVPILLADRKTGVVAAAHAGWRGLAERVPMVAVDALAREFGSRHEDLVVAVGPSIGAARYEVDVAVLARFEARGFSREHIDRWFYDGDRPEHWYFDGAQSAGDQLVVAGVPVGHIHVARLCTATHDAFCSYRRDGKAAGRMAAVIRRR